MTDPRAFVSAVFALCLALAAATPAIAETPGERLFFEGALREVPPGTAIVYGHIREGTRADPNTQLIADGEIEVRLRLDATGAREAQVAMSSGGQLRELNPFPASTGNPLLMVFLESSLRSMAAITGGSQFYIRNRMKDALFRGGELSDVSVVFKDEVIAAEQIVFRPFSEDKNRDRMGDFADLELRFVLSDQAPGGFILFSASTPTRDGEEAAYREEITFLDAREEG